MRNQCRQYKKVEKLTYWPREGETRTLTGVCNRQKLACCAAMTRRLSKANLKINYRSPAHIFIGKY